MLNPYSHWRTFWLVFAFALVVLLVIVVHSFLGTLVFGVFLYYSSRPIYDRLQSWVRPPTLAALTALTVLVLPVVLLFGYMVTLALGELGTLADIDISAYEELITPYIEFAGSAEDVGALFESLVSDPRQVLERQGLQEAVMSITTVATGFIANSLNSLFHLFIALTVAFYLLRDDHRLTGWVRNSFDDETLEEYGQAVDADLKTVFFGNILNALLTGVIGTVVFSLLGLVAPPEVPVPVPILLGLLTGVTSLVPIIGMRIVTVPVTLYLIVIAAITDPQLLWFPALFFVVSLIFVESIPDLVLRPYISGRNLHMGLVLFSYIFGPLLFGWYGLFLGPLLLVVLVHFAQIVIPELTRAEDELSLSPHTFRSTENLSTRINIGLNYGLLPSTENDDVTGRSNTRGGTADERIWEPTDSDDMS